MPDLVCAPKTETQSTENQSTPQAPQTSRSAAEAQSRELNAYGETPGPRGTLVPACVISDANEPGAVSRRQVGPIEELRLWNFATGSATLKPEHRDELMNLRVFGHIKDATIEIEGYASPLGGAKENQRLGQSRAEAVAAMVDAFDGNLTTRVVPSQGEAASFSTGMADGARDRAVVLRIRRPSSTTTGEGEFEYPWHPGEGGDLPNGFERRPQPPLFVLRPLQRTWEKWEKEMRAQGLDALAVAPAKVMGPSAGSFIAGRAGQAAAVGQGVFTFEFPEDTDTREAEMYRRGWLNHEYRLAEERTGYDPAYRLVRMDGAVLSTETYDEFFNAGLDPAQYARSAR